MADQEQELDYDSYTKAENLLLDKLATLTSYRLVFILTWVILLFHSFMVLIPQSYFNRLKFITKFWGNILFKKLRQG